MVGRHHPQDAVLAHCHEYAIDRTNTCCVTRCVIGLSPALPRRWLMAVSKFSRIFGVMKNVELNPNPIASDPEWAS